MVQKDAFNKITFSSTIHLWIETQTRNFKTTQTADLRAMSEHVIRPMYVYS